MTILSRSTPRWRRVLTAAATACTLGATAPAHALVNGVDTTSFAAVGAIGSASGVLIADNWVLTAAHVAGGISAGATVFETLEGSAVIDAVYFYSNEAFPGNDIALVHLGTALDIDTPVLNDQLITRGQLNNLGTLTMATAQNQTPNGTGITTAASVYASYTLSGTSHTVNWLVTDGNVEVAGGDSGSALFKGQVGDSGGQVLLGIASAALSDTSGNAQSAYVQVAAYKTWINTTMAASGQQALWSTSPVPEPGTAGLFALGGVAVFMARRHRDRRQACAPC